MLKKVTSLIISVLLVVACMAVPVMADGEVSVPGGTVTGANATLNVTQSGNYRIKFNGSVTGSNMDMVYLVEVTDEQGNKQDAIGVAPSSATAQDSYGGDITLNEGKYTLEFTNLSEGPSSTDFTLSFVRLGDAKAEDTYTIVKSFGDGATDKYILNNNSDNGLRWHASTPSWVTWTTDVAYAGDYDVYFYGGIESSTAWNYGIARFEMIKDTETPLNVLCNLPWTGKGGTSGDAFGGKVSGKNARVITKVGSVTLDQGQYTLKFTNAGSSKGIAYNVNTNKMFLVRRCKDNYELILKKNAGEAVLRSSDSAFAGGAASVTWNVNVKHAGEYDVRYIGSAQSSTENQAMSLQFDVWNQSINGSAEWTGAASKNKYGVNFSGNAGYGTVETSSLGRVMLDEGTYTAVLKHVSGAASLNFYDINLVRVGEYEDRSLKVDSVAVEDNKVVIDFSNKLDSTASNLKNITVTATNGTASVTLDNDDTSKVIVSKVSGQINISIDKALKDVDNVILYEDYTAESYIASHSFSKVTLVKTAEGDYKSEFTCSSAVMQSDADFWLVFYDNTEKMLGYQKQTKEDIYNGLTASVTFSAEDMPTEFAEAKLFVWGKDLIAPLHDSVDKTYAELNS